MNYLPRTLASCGRTELGRHERQRVARGLGGQCATRRRAATGARISISIASFRGPNPSLRRAPAPRQTRVHLDDTVLHVVRVERVLPATDVPHRTWRIRAVSWRGTRRPCFWRTAPTWTLHSPTTPMWRTILMAAVRSMWYSASVSVCDGATTIESPVWTPSGSKFCRAQGHGTAGDRMSTAGGGTAAPTKWLLTNLHVAHGDAVVVGVAHDFVLELLPPGSGSHGRPWTSGGLAKPLAHSGLYVGSVCTPSWSAPRGSAATAKATAWPAAGAPRASAQSPSRGRRARTPSAQ